MKSISDILSKQKIEVKSNERPINTTYEEARQFAEYLGINTLFVLRQFKIFGKSAVLKQRGWLKDIPYDPARGGKQALLVWRLKNPQI
jgi:hypothetical protein